MRSLILSTFFMIDIILNYCPDLGPILISLVPFQATSKEFGKKHSVLLVW